MLSLGHKICGFIIFAKICGRILEKLWKQSIDVKFEGKKFTDLNFGVKLA